jgi:hypothetical protein
MDCPKKALDSELCEQMLTARRGGFVESGTVMKSKRSTALASVLLTAFGCALLPVGSASVAGALEILAASGPDAAAITPLLNAYRSNLGNLNPNAAGSFGTGRREINWDGVPAAFSAPNLLPNNFFNVNSPRGVVFSTPGTGVEVSANAADGPVRFGNIEPNYPSLFQAFSQQKLFTPINSNIVDVSFFIPGSSDSALTRGFGAVFTDVDLPNTTSLTFFGATNQLLGTFFVPSALGDQTFSFLGVDFGLPEVSRVRITNGNVALAPGQLDPDVVVVDDFIYGASSRSHPGCRPSRPALGEWWPSRLVATPSADCLSQARAAGLASEAALLRHRTGRTGTMHIVGKSNPLTRRRA